MKFKCIFVATKNNLLSKNLILKHFEISNRLLLIVGNKYICNRKIKCIDDTLTHNTLLIHTLSMHCNISIKVFLEWSLYYDAIPFTVRFKIHPWYNIRSVEKTWTYKTNTCM